MKTRARTRLFAVAAVQSWAVAGCTTPAPLPSVSRSQTTVQAAIPPATGKAGVLVMAHGGGPDWNASVNTALAPLRDRIPVALALGMANPHTLQAALDSLYDRGVHTIAVVRLFVSGRSFLHHTEYLFGRRSDAPARAMVGHRMVDGAELAPLKVKGDILLDLKGLSGSAEVTSILADRARASATDPSDTGILLIAHGMGSEKDNGALLAAMQVGARGLHSEGYAEVRVATLREDWAAPRAKAEQEIRAAVTAMAERWGRVVVIPYRVSGFGPYREVLDGLDYVPAGSLLPHPLVTDWIRGRVTATFCAAGAGSPLASCPADPVVSPSRQSGSHPRLPAISWKG
ncbi:MAG: hypothetical protein OXU69_03730 [Gemmatimonadota bacterium]|nr:hypothetical protein [Gemmatimonadota bacterium]MDE2983794.1 hypothetical protein [Gemmatimonadota bacterium]